MRSWWNKTLTLIWESYSGDLGPLQKSEKYLLHCALSSSKDMPPLLIGLLVRAFPRSVSVPVPGTKIYPVHIAASADAYNPQAFEIPCKRSAFRIVMDATPRTVSLDMSGRPAVHIAIDSGKNLGRNFSIWCIMILACCHCQIQRLDFFHSSLWRWGESIPLIKFDK